MSKSKNCQASRPIDQTEECDSKKLKQSRSDLKQSKEDLADIFNSVLIPMLVIDRDFSITEINNSFLKFISKKKQEVLGRKCYEIVHGTDKPPKDCSSCRAFKTRQREDFELYHPELKKHLLISSTPVLKDGAIEKVVHTLADITQQKQAEQALRESEEKYRNIVESSLEGIWQIDENALTTYVSPKMGKILGYSEKEMLGKNLMEFMDETAREEAARLFARRKQGISEVHDFRFKHKTGRDVFTTLSTHPIKENNKFYGAVAYVADVTEKKKAEHALKESEEKFRALFEEALDGIFIIDTHGKIIMANKSFAQMHGYTVKELTKMGLKDLDTPESARNIPERMKKLAEGKPLFFESEHYHKDGHVFPLEVNAFRIKIKDKPFIIAFHHDITERKKAEKQKQKLQDQLKKYTKQLEARIGKQKFSLNSKEKLVLAALTCYPHYNDQLLAKATQLKRSTITSIRNRLKQNNWYQKINIPNFKVLNYEILSFMYADDIQSLPLEKIQDINQSIQNIPSLLFSQLSDSFGFGLSVYSDLTKAHQAIQKSSQIISHPELIEKINQIRISLPSSLQIKLFDYSNIIKSLFSLDLKPLPKIEKFPAKKLSKNEKELLYTFTKFPNANYQKIQELTRLSKPTIIRIKKKLFNQDYLRRVTIPNTKKLGFAFSNFTYYKFNKTIFDKKPLINQLAQQSRNTFFSVIDDEQILFLSIYRDYNELEEVSLRKKNIYQKIFKTLETPKTYPFQNYKTLKLDFSGLVKEALSLNVDY